MSLRLAVCLEAYAIACAHFISENTNAEQQPLNQDEQYPNWNVRLPQPPEFPDDPDGWLAIDRSLAGRCLNLPAKIQGSQSVIDSMVEHEQDDLYYTLDEEAAQRGLEAWRLAMELRRKQGVEPVETVWDYAAGMEGSLSSAQKRRAERARRSDY